MRCFLDFPKQAESAEEVWECWASPAFRPPPGNRSRSGCLTVCHRKMPLAPEIQKCRSSLCVLNHILRAQWFFIAHCFLSLQSINLLSQSMSLSCFARSSTCMHPPPPVCRTHCFRNHHTTNVFSNCWSNSPNAMAGDHHTGPSLFTSCIQLS